MSDMMSRSPIVSDVTFHPSAGTKVWEGVKGVLLAGIIVALIVLIGSFWIVLTALSQIGNNTGADNSLAMFQQAGCLTYYEFVVDEARAGMSPAEIQKLVDLAARGAKPDARFDTVRNGCGDVASVLQNVPVAARPTG